VQWLARGSGRPAVVTAQTRAPATVRPRRPPSAARAGGRLCSETAPGPPWSPGSCDINILSLTTQVKHTVRTPSRDHALKLEVTFCVRGVASPLLANIYLHYALDEWFAKVVRRCCAGEVYLVRYADDYAACFQEESEARRFRTALEGRLGEYHLELEPTKTRVLRFGRFAKHEAAWRGERPAVFDFLGFTHYCGTSRSGRFKLKWRTSKKRFRAKLHAMREWIRSHLTVPVAELWKTVNRKLAGHYAYYYVSDNWRLVREFRQRTLKALWWGLNRRSQRRSFTWQKYLAYVDRYPLASPRRVVNLNPVATA